jgi:hypothetical protein
MGGELEHDRGLELHRSAACSAVDGDVVGPIVAEFGSRAPPP